jgi:phage-related tail fiber protein
MTNNNKIILASLLTTLVVAVLVYFVLLDGKGSNNDAKEQATTQEGQEAATTSSAPTAQADFSGASDDREPGNSLSEDNGASTVEDTDTVVSSENPIFSEDGKTILSSPANGQAIETGTIISGSTDNDNVFYRLIDSKSGLTGEGELAINDGTFSAKLNIDSRSTEGRLDVFSRNSDGTEYSIIYVDVRFE